MNASLQTSLKPITQFISKYGSTIYISAIGLLLAAAIFLLFQAMSSNDTASTQQTATVNATFDQDTVKKIDELHESSDSTDTLAFPTPRSNPFVE